MLILTAFLSHLNIHLIKQRSIF